MGIIKDKDLIYDVMNYDVVLVATSIKNHLSNGIQRKLAKSFPWIDEANNETLYDDKKKLGTCTVSQKDGYPTFVLCYIFTGRFRPDIKPDMVDYDALASCLNLVAKNFHGKKIACTVLGHSEFEGGGEKKKCLSLIENYLYNETVTVYDYKQLSWREEQDKLYHETEQLRLNNEITVCEYYNRKKKLLWESIHGYYSQPPENISYRALIRELKNNNNK